ncbi:N-acetylglucosamine-6-phosphate deacetylase [Halobacillus fulvus]|nr:N-acetylglucosamine-6-phosphate deacetylase [Halobacillus fulvus]
MAELVFENVTVALDDGRLMKGSVCVEGGKISEVTEHIVSSADHKINGEGYTLVPGFIDVHIHGANGHDVMDASEEAVRGMARQLPKEGTTSFLATTMTQSDESIASAVANVGHYMKRQPEGEAEVLGIHLEGPFISEKKAGAQPAEHIQKPSVERFQKWQEESDGQIKLVTLAPEVEGAQDFIEEISRTGVICSLGHSDATWKEADEAVRRGARHVTHLYNQMSGLHHREPGLVGAALTNRKLNVELIVDHIHVHPEAVRLAYETMGSERTLLITDAMRAKCLPSGTYDLGGQDVIVKEGEARLADGTLAGSILTLEEAARKMKTHAGATIHELVRMTSSNAAKELGVYDRKGSIAEGKDADLVLLDDQHNVALTVCRGRIAFDKSGVYQ